MTAWPLLSAAKGHDLRPWLRQADRPGVIVGVLSGGRVHSWRSQGRGGIDEDAAPLTPTTAFYVASVSKQFTASCVATCVAAGELDVGNSVRSYIPELPSAFDPITLRHLLHHLGGLPHGHDLAGAPSRTTDWWDGKGLWDLIAVLAKETELATQPGERFAYSNAGYWLLAASVERACGETFATVARQRLFEPLGMRDSRFRDNPDTPQAGLVVGHATKDGALSPIETRFHGVGDGGLLTTLEDLARWDLFWSGRSALGPALPAKLIEQGRRNDGTALNYAWGVAVRSHRGVRILNHGGSYIGYLARLIRFPEQDFSIACLANADDLDVNGLSVEIADAVLGDLANLSGPSWVDTVRDEALATAGPWVCDGESEGFRRP